MFSGYLVLDELGECVHLKQREVFPDAREFLAELVYKRLATSEAHSS